MAPGCQQVKVISYLDEPHISARHCTYYQQDDVQELSLCDINPDKTQVQKVTQCSKESLCSCAQTQQLFLGPATMAKFV